MARDLSAYLKTKVSHYRTQEVITGLLERQGIDEVRFTQAGRDIILEFNYPDEFEGKAIKLGVRFKLTVPKTDNEKERKQLRNQYYRALFYVLKSKLESVEFGIREFGQEFLGDLIYKLPDGRTGTVAEIIAPQLQRSIAEGKSEVLMLEDRREGE